MAEIGWATLGIIPSFRGFSTALESGSSKAMVAAGATGGVRFGDEAGRSAGRSFGNRFKSTLKTVGLFGGLGAAFGAAGFIKDSVELEAVFSKTMAQIGVATEAPRVQLERLDALALKLGKDTVFSASDASQAMLELAKNGIGPATIEAGALQSALTLASAGGVDMTEAATTMGNALNAFNLEGKESASVAAALAGAANSSSASVGSIAEGLQQVSAVSADAGFTLQETTGALAAFANAGISGSDAGTSLKTALTRLMPANNKAAGVMNEYGLMTYNAAEAAKNLREMGLTPLKKGYEGVYDAIGKYLVKQGVATEGTAKLGKAVEDYMLASGIVRNDFVKKNGDFKNLAAISGELSNAFKDLSDSERAQALNAMFGSDARRAATVLMNEGAQGIRDYVKATSDQKQADRLAKANMEGTAGAIERLKGSWETAKLEFGKALAPVAQKALDGLADSVDEVGPKLAGMVDWLVDHGDEFAKFGGQVQDAAGHVGDLIGFLNDLPKSVKIAGLAGLVGALGASKIRGGNLGGGGGVLGTAGKALGLAKPVPVFVTNPGFGAGGGDLPGGGKKGIVKKALPFATALGPAGLALGGSELLLDYAEKNYPKRQRRDDEEHARRLADSFHAAGDQAAALNNKANTLRDHLTVITNGATIPFKSPGLDDVLTRTRTYEGILEGIPREVRTTFIQSVQRNNVIEPGDGRGGKTPAGVSVNIYGDVRPADSREFYRDVQRRSRSRAGGGR